MNTLVLHQSKLLRTDGRLRLATLTAWGLCFVALLNGCLYFSQNSAIRAAAQKASYEQWLNQPQKNAHSAAHYGFYAYKPLPVTAVVDKGFEDYLGSAVWMEAHNQNEVKVRAVQDAPFLARFNDLTLGFVWACLFPLVIILFAFNAVSAEQEQGTLRMILVSGVSQYAVLKAKFWAVYHHVMLIFLPTFGVACAAMLGLDAANFNQYLPHLALNFGFLSLFFAFFSLVGVGVSAVSRSSGYALFSLLSVWLLMSFVLPRVNAFVVRKAFPTPTAYDFTTDMKSALTEGSKERTQALEAEYLAKYKVDSVKNLPINFVGVSLGAGEKHGDEIHDKFYGNLNATLNKQDQLMAFGAIFSPVTAMRNVIMALAGTDNDKTLEFEAQAETHRRLIQKTMNDAIVAVPKDPTGKIPMAETSLWQKVPPFVYRDASIGQILGQQWLNILILLLWGVGTWWILKRISERIKV
jgi:ABC-2 type transport system permease protein